MRKKILAWLDGPYGYLHYGIAIELDKLTDCEFYALVSYERDIDFYKKQTKIDFKELHYYPKYYIDNKTKPDLAYLHNLEQELGLNFWLIAYAERTFLEERGFFHKFSSDEILSIIEALSKFFLGFLRRTQPDFIIMQKTGENLPNLLLFYLAKSLGIKTLMLVETRLSDSFIISDDLEFTLFRNVFEKNKRNHTLTSARKFTPEYIHEHTLSKTVNSFLTTEFGKATLGAKIGRYLKRLSVEPEPIYYNKGKTKSKMLQWRIVSNFELRKRVKFLNNNALKFIPPGKFIYFPLPVQPESQSYAWAPFHTNLISLVENIAKSIPSEYLLFVKEHPGQIAKSWRPVSFYQKILSLPNVRLIHQHVNNFDILSKCDLSILINSSTGLESLFYKKPVITFSHVLYDVVTMVKKAEKMDELPQIINQLLYNFTFNDNELSLLIETIEQTHIIVPYWGMMKDFVDLTSLNIHLGVDKSLSYFDNLFKKYSDRFSIMAKYYYKSLPDS